MSYRSVWQNWNARNSSAWWISRSSILSSGSCASLGKQAQETLESELLEQVETFKNVRGGWTLVQDQIEQKRGWLIGETVIVSDPQQCQVKLAGISIHCDLGMCVISSNVELHMMEISAFSHGVVNNWNNTQPESVISAGDRIISFD